MENLTLFQDTGHEELLRLINPLVDFLNTNGYNFFIVAGKDNICTRHLAGSLFDVTGMITGLMEVNKEVEGLIKYCVEDFENNKL